MTSISLSGIGELQEFWTILAILFPKLEYVDLLECQLEAGNVIDNKVRPRDFGGNIKAVRIDMVSGLRC